MFHSSQSALSIGPSESSDQEVNFHYGNVPQSTYASWNPVLRKIDKDFLSLSLYGELAADSLENDEDDFVEELDQFKAELTKYMKFVSTELFIHLKSVFAEDHRLAAVAEFEQEAAVAMRNISESIERCARFYATDRASSRAEFRVVSEEFDHYQQKQVQVLYPLYLDSSRPELRLV